ncbi:SRPBCC domain-containing protein [Lentibacter algarum]|uniref:SRPBCC domain-containing protein n=1 Tax=Lentibacter algarum TaxID=576131 RepID=UPI001C08E9EA|nr:SRPBCC domain-containing protein [Lentibacter algarum]MBU2983383.1 SRPBCC domain-containing protein [Lentibacter algarum]
MSDPEYAKAIHNRTFIKAPIETVWSTLVATDEPLPFFFGSTCETRSREVGAKLRMVSPNGKLAMVVGEVLAFEPPHKYAHTFQMTGIDEPPCKVTYCLSEKDGGTEFNLIIEDAVVGSKLIKEMKGAQSFISANLKALCETGKPAFSGRMVGLLGPIFAMLAKDKQKIESWPLD